MTLLSLQVLPDRRRDPPHHLWDHSSCQHPKLPRQQPLVSVLAPFLPPTWMASLCWGRGTGATGSLEKFGKGSVRFLLSVIHMMGKNRPWYSSRAIRAGGQAAPHQDPSEPLSLHSCWLVWRPSLGAFYVPVAFILLVTWIYFLCAGLSLQCRPSHQKDIPEPLEPPPRLGGTRDLLTDSGSISVTLNSGPPCPEGDAVYSLRVQFWALVATHALYVALWTFGAMAVSQRWYLNIVFSCLYSVTAVALGLFIFVHHCLRRRDVLSSWFSCCPSYRNALPMQAYVHPGLGPEDGSQVFIGCDPEAARSGASSSSSPSSAGSAGGRCKLTNLQVAQSQGEARPAPCPEQDPADGKPVRHSSNLHGRRSHRGRTKPCRDGKHHRLKMLRGPSEQPSSESGSLHNSHSESYPSGRTSPASGGRAGPRVAQDGDAVPSPSEGSDGGRRVPDFAEARRRNGSRDNLRPGGGAEREAKRRSYPLNVGSHNGGLKGSKYDINLASADSVAGMKTGLWKSETTV